MRKRGSVVAVIGAALILSACSSTATDTATTTEESPAEPTVTEEAEVLETVSLRWRTRPDNQAETDLYASISDKITAKGIGLDLIWLRRVDSTRATSTRDQWLT
jgi:multiple sugar transport system substrate-binding protein